MLHLAQSYEKTIRLIEEIKIRFKHIALCIFVAMAWFLFFFWLGISLILLRKLSFFKESTIRPMPLSFLFLLKVLAGIIVTLIYTYYYTDRSTADMYKYLDDAQVIASALPNHPTHYLKLMTGIDENAPELTPYYSEMHNWSLHSETWFEYTQTKDFNLFSSNRIITRFNALLWPVTQGNIFTHVIFMCFISFSGLIALFKLLIHYHPERKTRLVLLIFLWPSVLLWTSGVLKDGLIVAAFYLMIYWLDKFISKSGNRIVLFLAIVLALILLLITKYYVVVACIPALIAWMINHFRLTIPAFRMQLLVLGICFITLIKMSYSGLNPDVISMLHDKREESLKAAILGNARNQLFVDNADPGIAGFIRKIPEAISTGLIRPFIGEGIQSPLILISSLENVLLLLLLLGALIFPVKELGKDSYIWLLISYSLCLAFIIGFTTPVTGGIVRYKTAFLPALLAALSCMINEAKIPRIGYFESIKKRSQLWLFTT